MSRVLRCLGAVLVGLFCSLLAQPAAAHKPSDSYLTLRLADGAIQGQWDIALRDLDFALGLDADGNGEITWGELRAKHGEIAAYALARLAVEGDGVACPLRVGQAQSEQQVDQHSDGAYTVLRFQVDCAGAPERAPEQLRLNYRLFADIDPQHRGLLRLEAQGLTRTAILGPQAPTQSFELKQPGRLRQFVDYARDGVWHIWIGFDHILFLVSLLLPAVLLWQNAGWQPVARFRDAFADVLKIVTSFTVAHSITLTLATLGVLALPSRWVEATIAGSVVLAALNNLFPVVRGRRWVVAFVFGLIHGFGFASVLADLGLPQGTLALALVGFNLGVEVGQLAIVAVFLPLAFWLRGGVFYRRAVLVGGSLAIVGIAGAWFAERAFELEPLLF